MYKFSHHLLPDLFDNFFITNREIHNYPTRNSNKLRIPMVKTTVATNFIKRTGVGIWNGLDEIIKKNLKIGTFKFYLNKFLIDHY